MRERQAGIVKAAETVQLEFKRIRAESDRAVYAERNALLSSPQSRIVRFARAIKVARNTELQAKAAEAAKELLARKAGVHKLEFVEKSKSTLTHDQFSAKCKFPTI